MKHGLANSDDPSEAIQSFVRTVAYHVEASGYQSGGPLMIVAMETATSSDRLNIACREAYDLLRQAFQENPQDKPKFSNHLIKFALKTMSGDVLRDAEHHAEVIKNSPLDWIIVRGPMLTDGPHTGKYRIGLVGVNTSARISRADVADFLLKQVTDNTYLLQAPMISN